MQNDVNRAKIGKIDKYEYLAGEKIIPLDQRRVIEQAKFVYSLLVFLVLAFAIEAKRKKQTKTIEVQGKKQVEALEILKPEEKEDTKSSKDFFQKRLEIVKLKMNYMTFDMIEKKMYDIGYKELRKRFKM